MQKNVAGLERITSLALGGMAIAKAMNKNSSVAVRSAAGGAGAALLWRGVTGHCPVYKSLDIGTQPNPHQLGSSPFVERSMLINLPIEDVCTYLEQEETYYGYFRRGDYENDFEIDLADKHWTLSLEEYIDKKRTLIKMSWSQSLLPAGGLKSTVFAKKDQEVADFIDLRKLKAQLETGEIPTIEGQPAGERSALGSFLETFGEFLLHKLQSKTALPSSPYENSHPIQSPMKEASV